MRGCRGCWPGQTSASRPSICGRGSRYNDPVRHGTGRAIRMRVWQAHERAVVSLAFSPAGSTLATAGDDEPGVRVWDVAAGAVQRELALFKETATCLTFSPDGNMLAAGRPWSVELWDPATGDQ